MIMLLIRDLTWTYRLFFFFNDTATTEIYTLSLHDALPICRHAAARSLLSAHGLGGRQPDRLAGSDARRRPGRQPCTVRIDRKSTRLNSSHGYISYAVFCLKKKKTVTTR